LGGEEAKIASFDAGEAAFAWSPDEKFLIAAKSFDEIKTTTGAGALFLIPVDAGAPRQLLAPEKGGWYESPVIAPSGRALAFLSCKGAKPQRACGIFTVKLASDLSPVGEPKRLAAGRWFAGLTWTADSRSLIYALYSGAAANSLFLWSVDAEGAGRPARLELASAGAWCPAASLTGNRLAFARMVTDADVWRLEPGHPPRPLLVSSESDITPQFSPDGRRIAFVSERGMDGEHIWLSNSDGTSLMELTPGRDLGQGSPRWSPDGRSIAFESYSKQSKGKGIVTTIDVASGETWQLSDSQFNTGVPSWSGDGRFIYFRSDRSGRSEVWRLPAHGGAAEQITKDGGNVAVESPDGEALYYTKTGGDGPVFSQTPGANDERQVLPRIKTGRGFAVFNDGIYYLDYTGDPNADPGLIAGNPTAGFTQVRKQYEIRYYEFSTGRSRIISPVEALPALGFSVSPDRSAFLVPLWKEVSMNIMLIENFHL
jgi:dipeptidyl aminopeptidase/acylaminoacyl peptidase